MLSLRTPKSAISPLKEKLEKLIEKGWIERQTKTCNRSTALRYNLTPIGDIIAEKLNELVKTLILAKQEKEAKEKNNL